MKSWDGKEQSVYNWVCHKCEGDDYDRGSLEAARAQADNATKALAGLVDLLHRKGLISELEIEDII